MLAKSDIEPAWTLLSFGSLQALRQEPSDRRLGTRFKSPTISADEIVG